MGQHSSSNIQLDKLSLPRISRHDKINLCQSCKALFQGTDHSLTLEMHHTSIASLNKALRDKCCICTSMWDRLLEDDRFHFRNKERLEGLPISRCLRFFGTTDRLDPYYCHRLIIEIGPAAIHLLPRRFHFGLELMEKIDSNLVSNTFIQGGSTSASLDIAHSWYTSCRSSHEICNRTRPSDFLGPSRLIKIDVGNGNSWKLLEGAEEALHGVPYASLSHCWGLKPLLRLTSSTISQMKTGMPVSALPKTFRDAITVARRFNMSFIWIDSLCILQDSAADWLRESSKMKDVYIYADFNIAATAASCSSDGGFYNRPACHSKELKVVVEWAAGKECMVVDCDYFKDQIVNAPLNQRAWVVQERILSPRIIHLGKRQLFWECDQTFACESWPRGIPGSLDFMLRGPFRAIERQLNTSHTQEPIGPATPLSPNKSDDQGQRKIYRLWTRIAIFYMRCSLTKADDKLVALSGIAQLFKEALKDDEYLAGLWKKDLAAELLWVSDSSATRSLSRAPSWSWASIDGAITDGGTGNTVTDYVFLIEILDAKTYLRTEDPTGQVSGGLLSLRGFLMQGWQGPGKPTYGNLIWLILRGWSGAGGKEVEVFCTPDTETNDLHGPLFCLPIQYQIRQQGSEMLQKIQGIVLVEKPNLAGRFRRVAFWESKQDSENSFWNFGVNCGKINPGKFYSSVELRTVFIE